MAFKRKTTKSKPAARRAAPAARRRRVSPVTKRRVMRRRRSLSNASPAAIKAIAMDMVFAGIGAAAAMVLSNQKFLDTQSETNKAFIVAGVAIATGTILKQPRIAVGMGAIAALKLIQGLGAGKMIGMSEDMFLPISEGMPMEFLPYGLEESADYANLSEGNLYGNNYGNNYANI